MFVNVFLHLQMFSRWMVANAYSRLSWFVNFSNDLKLLCNGLKEHLLLHQVGQDCWLVSWCPLHFVLAVLNHSHTTVLIQFQDLLHLLLHRLDSVLKSSWDCVLDLFEVSRLVWSLDLTNVFIFVPEKCYALRFWDIPGSMSLLV